MRKDIYYKIRIWERANDSDFRSHVIVNVKLIKCMLLVSRVKNLDMFALYFLGKPSSIYDKDNPDWAPSQKLGYDCNKVKESSQDRYNRAQERVEKRRRSEGAIALMELSKATMEETVDVGVSVEELNCKACQTDITSEYFTELIQNEETLKKENAALKEQLKQNSLSQDSFKEDNDKVLTVAINRRFSPNFLHRTSLTKPFAKF